MALEKSFDKFGSTFADAYHNISDLRYHVHEYQQTTLVEQDPDEDGNPVPPVVTTTWETQHTANFTGKNLCRQCSSYCSRRVYLLCRVQLYSRLDIFRQRTCTSIHLLEDS